MLQTETRRALWQLMLPMRSLSWLRACVRGISVSEKKLKAWADAGLIDDAAVARIREWEAANSRPLGLWALIGLGALAIGLGLISLVAANWEDIPGMMRLAIHMVLLLGTGGLLWWQKANSPTLNTHFHEALLLIFGALGLTFFGHLGQVYQTSSPLWQLLALWLLLFTALMLGFGRGWISATLWMAALGFTAQQHWDWYLGSFSGVQSRFSGDGPATMPPIVMVYQGLVSSFPALVVALAAGLRGRSTRPDFWRRLEQIALTLVVIWFSFAGVFRMLGGGSALGTPVALIQSVIVGAAAAAVFFARPGNSGQATAAILGAAAFANLFSLAMGKDSLGNAIVFMTIWGTIAAGALHAGWRVVFQIAVSILALRLIILSFELASNLFGSGLGLILAGIATLGIAFAAVRLSRRFAPRGEAA